MLIKKARRWQTNEISRGNYCNVNDGGKTDVMEEYPTTMPPLSSPIWTGV